MLESKRAGRVLLFVVPGARESNPQEFQSTDLGPVRTHLTWFGQTKCTKNSLAWVAFEVRVNRSVARPKTTIHEITRTNTKSLVRVYFV